MQTDTLRVTQPAATASSETLASYGPHLALLAACLATGGSLFMSEVWGWIPCTMCWYQRICMYPLVIVLLVGVLRGDRGVHLTALPLAGIGSLFAIYHYLLIRTDWLPAPRCMTTMPCNIDYINLLGFINIPLLALMAFLIIMFGVTAPLVFEAAPAVSRRARQAAALIIVLCAVGFGIAAAL